MERGSLKGQLCRSRGPLEKCGFDPFKPHCPPERRRCFTGSEASRGQRPLAGRGRPHSGASLWRPPSVVPEQIAHAVGPRPGTTRDPGCAERASWISLTDGKNGENSGGGGRENAYHDCRFQSLNFLYFVRRERSSLGFPGPEGWQPLASAGAAPIV